MSPSTIQGAEYSILKVFSNDFAFTIPRYQRPYAWTTEQAGELLEDLLGFLGEGNEKPQDLNPYFLGSIVLIKGGEPKADVVDGQQRLTTLTILLAALRALQPQYATHLTNYLYEQGDPIAGTSNRYRMTLSPRDAEFFQKYVQDEGGLAQLKTLNTVQLTDSRKNIQQNALLYLERLGKLKEQRQLQLAQFIVTRCFLVVVSTPDLDSGYRIFSVLNDRGLDLTLTDILKSEIIGKIPAGEQDGYTQKWEHEEEDLERDGFQELFTHLRMIAVKAKPRESVLKEIRSYLKPTDNPQKFIDQTLIPSSDAFEMIKHASYESDHRADEVNALFRWLDQVDNVDWVPPAIAYLREHQNEPEALIRFFTDLERLAAGLMIQRANVNDRLERYGRLLTTIEQKADLYTDGSPLQLTTAERQEIVNVLNGDVYSIKRIRQYVLLRLDSTMAGAEATYHYPVISIEHVLPQHPKSTSDWVTLFPTQEVRDQFVNKIGNLALLSKRKNAQAQNYDLVQKKTKYFSSDGGGTAPFALTTQILQQASWTPEIVEQRQQVLVNKLKALWRL